MNLSRWIHLPIEPVSSPPWVTAVLRKSPITSNVEFQLESKKKNTKKITHSAKHTLCFCHKLTSSFYILTRGGGPRVVVSTAAFHARVRGSVPGLSGFKETKMFLPHPRVKVSIVGSLRDREVACSASDRQGSNFESCVWRTVSSLCFAQTKMFLLHPRVKVSIVGSLRDREVACSASDRQGSNFESCVWRTVSS